LLEMTVFRNQIWKNKHLWDGFIRCCAMTQPESYAVLCKLGKPELESVLAQKPELRGPLLEYALETSVRPYVLDVLKADPNKVKEEKKVKVKVKQEPQSDHVNTNNKKRSREEMMDGDEEESDLEPSKKRMLSSSSSATTSDAHKSSASAGKRSETAAYRVQFFLNKFVLQNYKHDALFKMENFLRHNFANLLKIDPEHIIGVKCHRQFPQEVSPGIPDDTVICEVFFGDAVLEDRKMLDVVKQFQTHLKTMDFSSWKIYVGAQYVTVQPLTRKQLLYLIKQLNITLPANLDKIAEILQLAQQSVDDGLDDDSSSSRKRSKHKERDRKKRKHKRKHKHRSKRHKSKRKRRKKHRDSSDDDDVEDEGDSDQSDEDQDSENETNDSSKENSDDEATEDESSENDENEDENEADEDEQENDDGEEESDEAQNSNNEDDEEEAQEDASDDEEEEEQEEEDEEETGVDKENEVNDEDLKDVLRNAGIAGIQAHILSEDRSEREGSRDRYNRERERSNDRDRHYRNDRERRRHR